MSAPRDGFDYPALLRESLLGLVRGLLAQVAREGLPGDHHFVLTFGTGEPGVKVSPRLLKQYPEEMTIVLQHQFWNLDVDDAAFRVTLRFGGTPEPLTVPWAALRAFADPSVGFGLRLQAESAPGEPAAAEPSEGQPKVVPAPTRGASERPAKAEGNVLAFGARKRRDPNPTPHGE